MATGATVLVQVSGMQLVVEIAWSEPVSSDEAAVLYKKIEEAIVGAVSGAPVTVSAIRR